MRAIFCLTEELVDSQEGLRSEYTMLEIIFEPGIPEYKSGVLTNKPKLSHVTTTSHKPKTSL